MKTWSGTISKKFYRDFQGTKLHSFQIDGSDLWFRTGKDEVPQIEGEPITFKEKNSQVLLDSVVSGKDSTATASVTEAPESAVTLEKTTATSAGSSTTQSSDVGKRMAWEAARRDATRIVATALEVEGKGLEVLPWAKNTAKAKRLDLLVGYVNRVAKDLLEQQNDGE